MGHQGTLSEIGRTRNCVGSRLERNGRLGHFWGAMTLIDQPIRSALRRRRCQSVKRPRPRAAYKADSADYLTSP